MNVESRRMNVENLLYDKFFIKNHDALIVSFPVINYLIPYSLLKLF